MSRKSWIVAFWVGISSGSLWADVVADQWDAFLKKYLEGKSGKFRYQEIQAKGPNDIEKILGLIASTKTEALSENAKKALYINFYNMGMIHNLLRHAKESNIAVDSEAFRKLKINEIKVPGGNIWNGDYKHKFEGIEVTQDDIEKNLILGRDDSDKFKKLKLKELDPRIHAAVNCAALSCPRVREVAYREDNIDKMLDENMREFLSSDEQFKKLSDDKMRINSIIIWYYSDFDDFAQDKLKLGGQGDYLASFIDPQAKDASWKMAHFKKHFNDRNALFFRASGAHEHVYNWLINDSRN